MTDFLRGLLPGLAGIALLALGYRLDLPAWSALAASLQLALALLLLDRRKPAEERLSDRERIARLLGRLAGNAKALPDTIGALIERIRTEAERTTTLIEIETREDVQRAPLLQRLRLTLEDADRIVAKAARLGLRDRAAPADQLVPALTEQGDALRLMGDRIVKGEIEAISVDIESSRRKLTLAGLLQKPSR